MKNLRGPRTPRAKSQSGDIALWASSDTEWGAGAGAGALPTHRAGPHLRDLLSQVWVAIVPTRLETSGRWPWPSSTHQPSWLGSDYLAPCPSSTSQLGSGPETYRVGHMSLPPFFSNFCSSGSKHMFTEEWQSWVRQESRPPCPHTRPTPVREWVHAPARPPQGLKGCESTIAPSPQSLHLPRQWGKLGEEFFNWNDSGLHNQSLQIT